MSSEDAATAGVAAMTKISAAMQRTALMTISLDLPGKLCPVTLEFGACALVPQYALAAWPGARMAKDANEDDSHYKHRLRELQIELVKLQRHLIEKDARVLVILEGRDGAGKDGAIKRLIEHMSPRETRVHAPGVPNNREASEWYFQRFVPFLPAGGEFVVFNRSWYNRAGV